MSAAGTTSQDLVRGCAIAMFQEEGGDSLLEIDSLLGCGGRVGFRQVLLAWSRSARTHLAVLRGHLKSGFIAFEWTESRMFAIHGILEVEKPFGAFAANLSRCEAVPLRRCS